MNIMVDIETMGKAPDGAIVSIGAVEFDDKKVGNVFYKTISLQNNVAFLRKIDPSTVCWWLKQSDNVKNEVILEGDSLPFCMDLFAKFVQANLDRKGRIWANGVSFDLEILRHCLREDMRWDIPWKYGQECCMRSLRALEHLYPVKKWHEFKDEAAHNALIDATRQAEYVLQFMNWYPLTGSCEIQGKDI